jgi:general secretion pathway protein K
MPDKLCNPLCGPCQTTADGFILVAALWIIAALATLAVIFSIYLANTAVSLSTSDDTIQSEALVFASLALTAYQTSVPKPDGPQQAGSQQAGSEQAGSQTRANPNTSQPQTRNAPPPPTRADFRFRLAHADIAVSFISEAARIDLNNASPQLLANFFAALGTPRQRAEQYAERIAGWTRKPKETASLALEQNNEEALYRAAGRTYSPRGAPFAHIDELSLVLDLPPDLIERAKPFLTIYSGKPQVDVLDAAPEVLAAIPGLTPDLLTALAEARRTAADPQSVARMLSALPLQEVVTVDGGDTYRVQVRIHYDNGRQQGAEVVILTGLTDKPYRVLSWRDGLDALSGSSLQLLPRQR